MRRRSKYLGRLQKYRRGKRKIFGTHNGEFKVGEDRSVEQICLFLLFSKNTKLYSAVLTLMTQCFQAGYELACVLL